MNLTTLVDEPTIDVLFRFVLVSDVHAVGRDSREWAHESTVVEGILERNAPDPFARLADAIEPHGSTVDAIVCCGDLTNRAGIDGYIYGIRKLEDLADSVGAASILITPGNHDLDVRDRAGLTNYRACLEAAAVAHRFNAPRVGGYSLDRDLFEIYRFNDELTIVNLDTNGRDPLASEARHGIISTDTIGQLERGLQAAGATPVMVLMCHHHPYRHGDIDLDDYSEIHGAPELLAMLDRQSGGSWVFVHGHKHQPRLAYSRGDSVAPAVFCAGSFSRTLDKYLQGVARNQCYIVELVRDTRLPMGHPPVGRFRSLDWAASKWVPSPFSLQSGLPSTGGFGARKYPAVMAQEVANLVKDSPGGRLSHRELIERQPELGYLVPTDVQRVLRLLLDEHGVYASTRVHDPRPFEYGVMDS